MSTRKRSAEPKRHESWVDRIKRFQGREVVTPVPGPLIAKPSKASGVLETSAGTSNPVGLKPGPKPPPNIAALRAQTNAAKEASRKLKA
jgi:hypothetical protein